MARRRLYITGRRDILGAVRFEVDTASARVVGEPEYSPGDVGAVRGEDMAMLAQIVRSEVLPQLLFSSLRREAVEQYYY
jgi:hypothetical protein